MDRKKYYEIFEKKIGKKAIDIDGIEFIDFQFWLSTKFLEEESKIRDQLKKIKREYCSIFQ